MVNIFFTDGDKNSTSTGKFRDLKSLGKTIESIAEQVGAGDYSDIYVGDYIPVVINNTTYNLHIAGFNIFYNIGDTAFTKNHIVLIPRENMGTSYMNSTDTTEGGYVGSYMYTTKLPELLNQIKASELGPYILSHRESFSDSMNVDATSNGYSGWKGASSVQFWHDSEIALMTETQIFGTTVFSSSGYDIGSGYMQFPIFRMYPMMINYIKSWYWERSIASSTWFCCCDRYLRPSASYASVVGGVRPYLCIGNP